MEKKGEKTYCTGTFHILVRKAELRRDRELEEKGKEPQSYRIEREFLEKVEVSELIRRLVQRHMEAEVKTS